MITKNNFIVGIVIVSLLGLPACSNDSSNIDNTTSNQTASQNKSEIKIGGSSSSYGFMQPLANVYEENKTSKAKISFVPASQSGAGIAGVQEGILEIASVARSLNAEESQDTQLDYKPVAKDGLLVATHSSVTGVTNLDTEQLKKIYSGEIKNWQEVGGEDAPIVLLDRPEDESPKKMLRKYYLGKELEISPDAVILRSEGDLISSIQSTPYSIGAFSLGYALSNDIEVNRLSLNGIAPTQENVAEGEYTMVRDYGVVVSKEHSDSVRDFIDFVFSPEGADTILERGLVPVEQQ